MNRDRRTTEQAETGLLAKTAGLLRRHPLALPASLLPALVAGIALAAPGSAKQPTPAKPATPTITSHPAALSNQTSAQFSYGDSTSGVSFECQLDGSAYGACPAAGKSYPGPLTQGKHTFKVRAVAGGRAGDDTDYSWTVDTTAPTPTTSFPADSSALRSATWGQGCSGHAAICGSAKDANGVSAVYVSIRQGNGKWWGGNSFDQTSESFRTATLSSGHGSTAWGYALPLPADGSYTVHVRALDEAGNTTPSGSQASTAFTVDSLAPPAPAIVSGPGSQTTQKAASFSFTDSQAGVAFLCVRDRGRAKPCTSPITYPHNSRSTHTFTVEALDAAGNLSAPSTYTWKVVKAVVEESGKPFAVAGNATGPLAPGFSSPLAVTVTNTNAVAITVTELQVTVAAQSSKPGCEGPPNLALTQSTVSASNPLVVPANGHVSLPSGAVSAPQVLMRDLPTNQDACKSAAFTFNYSGSAHS
jgi:hypothetical protein